MGHFPDPRFEAARVQGHLSVQDLWVRFLAVGGHGDMFDVDAHLEGVMALDPPQQDALACALNERLDELADEARIPYAATTQSVAVSALQQAVSDLLDGWQPPSSPDQSQVAPEPEADQVR